MKHQSSSQLIFTRPYAQNASAGFALLITCMQPGKVIRPPQERPRGGGGTPPKISNLNLWRDLPPSNHSVPTRPSLTLLRRTTKDLSNPYVLLLRHPEDGNSARPDQDNRNIEY